MASSSSVEITTDGATLIIAINRAAQRNAITREVSEAIAENLERLDSDNLLRVGILTGNGGSFCAGMDLKAFLAGERPELEGRGFGGLTECSPRKPLIAAVEGYALAGGFELALACDLIVASEGAIFGLPEVSRGLVAGSGGLVRLPQRIPKTIALEYALTGERMDAMTAHRWGLLNEVVPNGQALTGALALAERIIRNGPVAVEMTKQIVHESPGWPADDVWERQRPLVDAVLATNDAREGARAFAEKRAPQWTGR